jgi:hypothetical protein
MLSVLLDMLHRVCWPWKHLLVTEQVDARTDETACHSTFCPPNTAPQRPIERLEDHLPATDERKKGVSIDPPHDNRNTFALWEEPRHKPTPGCATTNASTLEHRPIQRYHTTGSPETSSSDGTSKKGKIANNRQKAEDDRRCL